MIIGIDEGSLLITCVEWQNDAKERRWLNNLFTGGHWEPWRHMGRQFLVQRRNAYMAKIWGEGIWKSRSCSQSFSDLTIQCYLVRHFFYIYILKKKHTRNKPDTTKQTAQVFHSMHMLQQGIRCQDIWIFLNVLLTHKVLKGLRNLAS